MTTPNASPTHAEAMVKGSMIGLTSRGPASAPGRPDRPHQHFPDTFQRPDGLPCSADVPVTANELCPSSRIFGGLPDRCGVVGVAQAYEPGVDERAGEDPVRLEELALSLEPEIQRSRW